jgi:hypothetical protein
MIECHGARRRSTEQVRRPTGGLTVRAAHFNYRRVAAPVRPTEHTHRAAAAASRDFGAEQTRAWSRGGRK